MYWRVSSKFELHSHVFCAPDVEISLYKILCNLTFIYFMFVCIILFFFSCLCGAEGKETHFLMLGAIELDAVQFITCILLVYPNLEL